MKIEIKQIKDLNRNNYENKLDGFSDEDLMMTIKHEDYICPGIIKKEDWNDYDIVVKMINFVISDMEKAFIGLMEKKKRKEWKAIRLE